MLGRIDISDARTRDYFQVHGKFIGSWLAGRGTESTSSADAVAEI